MKPEAALAHGMRVIVRRGRPGEVPSSFGTVHGGTPVGASTGPVWELHIDLLNILIEPVEATFFPGTVRTHNVSPGRWTSQVRTFLAAIFVSNLVAPGALAHSSAAEQAASASNAACVNDPSWTAPQAPFRIYGNTWHVGPRGLGVFLITAPAGHVLIDGGVPGNAPLIEANIQSLGFDLHDVKWIVNSHAHCDHAGGIAQLVRDTGAQVLASAADARSLARGGRDDPHYGDRFRYSPVQVTRTVTDGEQLRLGDLVLTAHSTPGHTKGNTTWTWKSCEGTRCLDMVDVGSLSAPGYKLLGNSKHKDVVEDFRYSFTMVEALPCDIALAPHPGMVDFWERVARRNQGDTDALIDPALCRAYAKDAREDFEEALAKQRRPAAPAKRQRP